MPSESTASAPAAPSRSLLITGGVLSTLAGIICIAFPLLSSALLVQFLGALAFVSGVVALYMAIAGKSTAHRLLHALSGIIRIAAGIALFAFVLPGMLAITLLLSIVLLVEGAFLLAGAMKLRRQAGWVALLLNGIISVLLGVLVWTGWPSTALWVLGLMFGIHLLFNGMAWLSLGLATPRARPATA